MHKFHPIKLIVILIFILLVGCSQKEEKETYTFYAMDTFISISFYHVENAKEIADNVEDIYLKYQGVVDDYHSNKNGSVYDLNQKREIEVSKELEDILIFALKMKEETNGYFNPFIGRLTHFWKEALDEGKVLSDTVVQEELAIMNGTNLEINNGIAKIIGDGNIDLGGVAKGYVTEQAKQYLEKINCHNYLLNAGTSNLVLGSKNDEPFKVGLSKALNEGYYYTLKIKDKAISTSSIKEQHYLINNKYYSHLISPKTGYPADEYETISIIGKDSGILDAYSTACFTMPLDEIKQFLQSKELDFLISKENKLLYKSEGVDSYA